MNSSMPHARKPQERPTFHPETVLNQPTLLDKLCVSPLVLPKSSGVDVRAMKLKEGAEVMMYGRATDEQCMDDATGSAPADIRSVALEKQEDLLVKLNEAELVGVKPTANGWYAELAIGEKEKQVVDAFSNAIFSHFKKDSPELAFVPLLSEPLPHELRQGIAAKVLAKVSHSRS